MSMAARIGDLHACPQATPGTPPVPHVGGAIQGPGCSTVLIGGRWAACAGDVATCVGPPDAVASGCTTVVIAGRPAARSGDPTNHGGAIVSGCATVLIGNGRAGGSASPAAGALAVGGAAAVEAVPVDLTGPLEAEAADPGRTWIGIVLRDDRGAPVADQPFEVVLEGGQVLSGRTDPEGHCRFEDIAPDQGEVSFTRIPDRDVRTSEEPRPSDQPGFEPQSNQRGSERPNNQPGFEAQNDQPGFEPQPQSNQPGFEAQGNESGSGRPNNQPGFEPHARNQPGFEAEAEAGAEVSEADWAAGLPEMLSGTRGGRS